MNTESTVIASSSTPTKTTASQYWKYGTNPTRAVQYSEPRANSMNSKTVKNMLNGSIGSTKLTPSNPYRPARKGGAPLMKGVYNE